MKKYRLFQILETDEDELNKIKDDVKDAIVKAAADGKLVPSEVSKIAEKFEIAIGIVESYIYEIMCSLLKNVGKHRDVPDSKFDSKQLKKGIEVEQEHTNDKFLAKIIAKDHLMEIPDYYTRLGKMEKTAGVKD